VQEARLKNDTVLQFLSPAANCCEAAGAEPGPGGVASFRTWLWLDNMKAELPDFVYHPDPAFNQLEKNVITENSIFIVTVRGGRGGSGHVVVCVCVYIYIYVHLDR